MNGRASPTSPLRIRERSASADRDTPPSLRRYAFDIAIGIVLPIICLIYDPIVFRGGIGGKPLLADYSELAYWVIGVAFVSLAGWMVIGRPAALFAGLLLGDAIFATFLGVILFPFSLIGLMALIGVLGFAPFATAFVFAKNARRAWRISGTSENRSWRRSFAATGIALACGFPVAAQFTHNVKLSRGIEMAISTDSAQASAGVALLKLASKTSLDRLVRMYEVEHDTDRRARMADAYRRITTEDIEGRLYVLND